MGIERGIAGLDIFTSTNCNRTALTLQRTVFRPTDIFKAHTKVVLKRATRVQEGPACFSTSDERRVYFKTESFTAIQTGINALGPRPWASNRIPPDSRHISVHDSRLQLATVCT
jgi:hypothetical protein